MREIKFRAWDNLMEKMITDETVIIYPNGSIEVGGYNTDTDDEPMPAIVVMQYTGNKDIDGKEVYDLDILQMVNDTRQKYQVRWDDEEGGWGIFMDDINVFKIGMTRFMQVVGNSYENPGVVK